LAINEKIPQNILACMGADWGREESIAGRRYLAEEKSNYQSFGEINEGYGLPKT